MLTLISLKKSNSVNRLITNNKLNVIALMYKNDFGKMIIKNLVYVFI